MRRTLALAGGVMLALAFSQFPEYAQQYEQRLGGAVDELRIITEKFDADATAAGLTREQAFARYAQTSDDFIAGQGRNAEETFLRHARLSADLTEISTASPMDRLRLLPKFLDAEVGRRALQNFEPGVPLTLEGLGWAGAGLAVGYTLVSALLGLILLPFRRRSRRTVQRAGI